MITQGHDIDAETLSEALTQVSTRDAWLHHNSERLQEVVLPLYARQGRNVSVDEREANLQNARIRGRTRISNGVFSLSRLNSLLRDLADEVEGVCSSPEKDIVPRRDFLSPL